MRMQKGGRCMHIPSRRHNTSHTDTLTRAWRAAPANCTSSMRVSMHSSHMHGAQAPTPYSLLYAQHTQ
jgi:hypothetical protein